ncbi:MAG: hypothetical protein FJW27_19870 [Acidimicrobiia bacterium]|nr:hypothetical protein [Acidimicrobiia bacterium]
MHLKLSSASAVVPSSAVTVGANTVALTQVSQSVRMVPRGTDRLPDVNIVDLSVKKRFGSAGLAFEPIMEVFNVMNANTILGAVSVLGPAYNRPNNILGGRLLKLGLNLDF